MTARDDKARRVLDFWQRVWNQGRIEEIDDFMTVDFVIHSAGTDIGPRTAFKAWVAQFQARIDGLVFDVDEIFSGGDKVASRWRITGRNRGFMDTPDNGKPLAFTGLTISYVDDDGRIREKWVERSAWELYPTIK